MTPEKEQVPSTVLRLAARIERDIRKRALKPGDRYFTAAELGKRHQVSTATAHRAMAALGRDALLVRRPKLGTFIGRGAGGKGPIDLAAIHVIVGSVDRRTRTFPFHLLIDAIRKEMGPVQVQINFLPAGQAATFIDPLLAPTRAAGRLAGVIAMVCPREVYTAISRIGAPFVIAGTPFEGQDFPSVDIDNRAAGRMLADRLARKRHRRIALLLPAAGQPGDHDFLDGVTDALTIAKLPLNALVTRILPAEEETAGAVCRRLLASPHRPTGVILRTAAFADQLMQAARSLKLRIPEEVDVVIEHRLPYAMPLPHIRPAGGVDSLFTALSRTLHELREGRSPASRHIVLPVEFKPAAKNQTGARPARRVKIKELHP